MTETKSQHGGGNNRNRCLSLAPLTADEALAALLQVEPEKKDKAPLPEHFTQPKSPKE